MRRRLSQLLLAGILLLLFFLAWLMYQDYSNASFAVPPATSTNRPLAISGMSYSNFQDDRLTSRVKVEQLQIQSRKFGIFRVRAVNEVLLIKASFDLYQSLAANSDDAESRQGLSLTAGLAESMNGLTSLHGMGRVTRAVIDSMDLQVFLTQAPYLQVSSRRAYLDIEKQTAKFEQARLVGRQGGFQLITPVLIWDEQRKLFHIPGDYRLLTAQGSQQGAAAVVDTDLNLRPLPGGTPPKANR